MKISKAITLAALIGMPYTAFSDEDLVSDRKPSLEYRAGIHANVFDEQTSWVESVIEISRNSGYAFVVDKSARQMDLYFRGVHIDSFDVSLSIEEPLEAKLYEDDGRVPEGVYHITKKKNVGESSFHRALMLNFPNKRDWVNFREAKRKGLIPPGVRRPGRYIAIHGDRKDKDGDWTEGCIALTNGDIDSLYHLIKPGTPVAIVKTYKKK